ncbi:hypothetical protein ACWEK5_49095 [Rhodococcus koreensis]
MTIPLPPRPAPPPPGTRLPATTSNTATGPIVATLAVPTPTQRRAFELLDSTIPHLDR